MFRSRWIIAVAFGIAIAGLVQAQEQAQHAGEDAATQSQPPEPNPIGIPVRIIEDNVSTDARERSEGEASEREKDDLIAQERMADATEAMNEATQSMKRASWVSAGLVGFGTLLLVWTLGLTRQANRAAQGAVNATKEIGEAQVRSYLFCKSAKFKRTKDDFTAIVEIGNAGQSPATDISITGNLTTQMVGGFPSMPRVHAWSRSEDSIASLPPIMSGGSASDEIWFFKDSSFREDSHPSGDSGITIFDDANEVALDIVVSWRDVFGQRHSFPVELGATIDCTPNNPKRKTSYRGNLYFRMDDPDYRVVDAQIK